MTVPAKYQHGNISYVSAASVTAVFLSYESHWKYDAAQFLRTDFKYADLLT